MFLTLNNMKNKKIVIVALMSLLLTACGSSGGSTEVVPDDTKTEVKLDVEDLNISNLEDYKLIVGGKEVSATSNDKLDIEKDSKDVVGLIDNGGQPILLARKYKGDSSVDVNLESSAEIFVLYSPRFNGITVTDPKKLSERIKEHKDFQNLVIAIKNAINNGNPCPLDPTCNYTAKEFSSKISNELNIDDLYEGGN